MDGVAEQVDQFMDLASQFNIGVLLDLHALRGS
jgi:hypothetical protein